MPPSARQGVNLESLLDSLTVELDRAQDTLSLKGLNRKLTYTVSQFSIDLQCFMNVNGDRVEVVMAKPGESGASKLAIQFGSITDRQIRETTRDPVSRDDVAIDAVQEIDDDVKQSLQRIGVRSVSDLERMERSNVDLPRIVQSKSATSGAGAVDYADLASKLKALRRRRSPPRVMGMKIIGDGASRTLEITGTSLAVDGKHDGFPFAALDDAELSIIDAAPDRLTLALPVGYAPSGPQRLRVALDPHAVMTVEVVTRAGGTPAPPAPPSPQETRP